MMGAGAGLLGGLLIADAMTPDCAGACGERGADVPHPLVFVHGLGLCAAEFTCMPCIWCVHSRPAVTTSWCSSAADMGGGMDMGGGF